MFHQTSIFNWLFGVPGTRMSRDGSERINGDRINGDRINGLFHPLINGIYWDYNPLNLTFDPSRG